MKLTKITFFAVVLILISGIGASAVSFGFIQEPRVRRDDGFDAFLQAATDQGSPNGWQRINCQDSALVTPSIMAPAEKCSMAVRTVDSPAREFSCRYDHYRARSNTPQEVANVHAIILQKSFNDRCAVPVMPGFANWFPRSLPVLRRLARQWTAAPTIHGASGLYFNFPNRHCYAYFLPGYAWEKGYTNVFIGFLCGPRDNSALSTSQIGSFLNGLSIRYTGFR